eukprot:TRINITY_DN2382_c0_g1_i20.p1 TRINITY_DN2382_c0_g1~~TRINITY_DN2382_c0_g1_i20.p1  ORF type:complete len:322 (+),score=73.30 TRINITY_DN2382_c0_g1_i20:654-1619(+)
MEQDFGATYPIYDSQSVQRPNVMASAMYSQGSQPSYFPQPVVGQPQSVMNSQMPAANNGNVMNSMMPDSRKNSINQPAQPQPQAQPAQNTNPVNPTKETGTMDKFKSVFSGISAFVGNKLASNTSNDSGSSKSTANSSATSSTNINELRNAMGPALANQVNLVCTKMSEEVLKHQTTAKQLFTEKRGLEEQEYGLKMAYVETERQLKALREEDNKVQAVIDEFDNLHLDLTSMDQVLQEDSPHALQLIELSAENKAFQDLNYLVENAFKKGAITLDDMLTTLRSSAEREFNNIVLMKKMVQISQSKKQMPVLQLSSKNQST